VHSAGALLGRRPAETRGAAGSTAPIAAQPAAERLPVALTAYDPEVLALTVEAPADGWLLVTDRWARGWRAEVNGAPAVVYGGNFTFRAVRVRAGPNQVRFTYHPVGVPWLVLASWGTLVTVVAWSAASFTSPRPRAGRRGF
jgi:hypothetical protein